uniref:Retrovirus-related Pol polyprotein from transposon TNT 1-94 n=1 Tax=Nicotiana tabacum TaxID=4097 RepID=A0A1S4BCP2_TOBAC|nr:PREDICTED: uncharacterized protein LOC107806882 [Nicotiana tabacum]
MGDSFASGTNPNNNDPVNPSVLQNNTSSTVIDVVATKKQIININPIAQLPIKLVGGATFATWKAQIQKVMNGIDLMGYLDGSITPPPHTIKQETQDVVNPDLKFWFQQDNLIANALMASVGSTIAPSIASAETSKEAWNYLELRTIIDELVVVGVRISNEELVVKILSGLRPEYEALKLAHKLTDHELYLKQAEKKKPVTPMAVQVAQRTVNNNNNGNMQSHCWSVQPQWRPQTTPIGQQQWRSQNTQSNGKFS